MIYSFYAKLFLFFILFSISIWLLKIFLDKPFSKIPVWKTTSLLGLLFGLVVVIRLIYLRNTETDVDTSTWLSAVISFTHYPQKLWTLLNYTDSRPLTVLPLVLGSLMGLNMSYLHAEVIGLIFWLITIYLIFRICTLFASSGISILITWSMCLFIGTIWFGFAAYNSEHVSVFLITLSLFGYMSYVYHKWNNSFISISIGFVLGNLVYAKFQNVPMGLVIGVFLTIEMLYRKELKNASLLLAASVIPTVLINIYYAISGNLSVFWNNYFWNNFYYSYTSQFSKTEIIQRFGLKRILGFIIHNGNSGYYLLTLLFIIAIGLVFNYKILLQKSGKEPKLILFSILLLLSSVYAVLQSGNDFEHYKLYLFIPLLLLTALVISVSPIAVQKYMAILLVTGSISQTARNINDLEDHSGYTVNSQLDDKVNKSIQGNSSHKDPIVIWGWCDRLFVKSGRAMGYRDAHLFHFSLKSPLIDSWTKDFVSDMDSNKPILFLEAMIPVYSEKGDLFLSHDHIPVIREYVQRNYSLIENIDGVKIYKRR